MIPFKGLKPLQPPPQQAGWEFLSPSSGQWTPFTEYNQNQISDAKAAQRPTVALSSNVFIDLRRMILRNVSTEQEVGVRLRLPGEGLDGAASNGKDTLPEHRPFMVPELDLKKGEFEGEHQSLGQSLLQSKQQPQWIIPDMSAKKSDVSSKKAKYSSNAAIAMQHSKLNNIPQPRGRFAMQWEKEQADCNAKVDQIVLEAAQPVIVDPHDPRFHSPVQQSLLRSVEKALRALGELSPVERRRVLESSSHALLAVLVNCGKIVLVEEEERALGPTCFLGWFAADRGGLQLLTADARAERALLDITRGLVLILQTPSSCNRLRYAVNALQAIQATPAGLDAVTTVRRTLRRPGMRRM